MKQFTTFANNKIKLKKMTKQEIQITIKNLKDNELETIAFLMSVSVPTLKKYSKGQPLMHRTVVDITNTFEANFKKFESLKNEKK